MIILRKEKEIPYNKENIEKYKAPGNLLRHARYTPGISGGLMLVRGNTLVGYIGWEKDWIIAVEVMPEFRRQGYAKYLLERALKAGCKGLTVRNTNIGAVNLYKSLGFVPYGESKNGRTDMIIQKAK